MQLIFAQCHITHLHPKIAYPCHASVPSLKAIPEHCNWEKKEFPADPGVVSGVLCILPLKCFYSDKGGSNTVLSLFYFLI